MSHLHWLPPWCLCLPPTCSASSLQTAFNKCMPSFACHYRPLVAFFRVRRAEQFCARPWYVPYSPLSCCFVSSHSPVFGSYTQVCQSLDISIQSQTIISSLCHGACPELQQTFYPVSIRNDLFGYQCFSFLKSFKWVDTTWGNAWRNELRCNCVDMFTFPL